MPKELILKLIETAHLLQAATALKSAVEAYSARLTVANCIEGLMVAQKLSEAGAPLRAAAESLVRIHFDEVRHQPQFGRVPELSLRTLLADSSLGVLSSPHAHSHTHIHIHTRTLSRLLLDELSSPHTL